MVSAARALPSDLHAKRSAHARLFPGFPGMNRLRKRPADAGALRLLDVGETKESIFPPEPPLLLHGADASMVPTTKAMGSLTRSICPAAPLLKLRIRDDPRSPSEGDPKENDATGERPKPLLEHAWPILRRDADTILADRLRATPLLAMRHHPHSSPLHRCTGTCPHAACSSPYTLSPPITAAPEMRGCPRYGSLVERHAVLRFAR